MSDDLTVQRKWIDRDMDDWLAQSRLARARAQAAEMDAREAEAILVRGRIIREATGPFIGRPLAEVIAEMEAAVTAAEDRATAADAEAQERAKEAATAHRELLDAQAVVAFLHRRKAAT